MIGLKLRWIRCTVPTMMAGCHLRNTDVAHSTKQRPKFPIWSADAIDFTGGANSLTTNPGGSLSGNIAIDSGSLTLNQTAAAGATESASYSNVITGAGSLIVVAGPSNTVTLSGANTWGLWPCPGLARSQIRAG